ncbi:MAG: hypothetical protein IH626_17585 [Rhodospirillales bacterium]|nr:hypothetical protein [Rhodospirillales bacterium]
MNDDTHILEPIAKLVNVQAEQIVIGGVMLYPRVSKRFTYLRSDDFAFAGHDRIWREIDALRRQGQEASPISLAQRLVDAGELEDVGGEKYIRELASQVIPSSSAEAAAELVRDLSNRRRLVAIAEAAARDAGNFDRSGDELVAALVRDLQRLAGDGVRQGQSKREVAEAIVAGLGKALPCYSTGIPSLDEAMGGGLFAGKLYGVAARKKVGKTILLGSISHNLNAAGVRHAFIALEMSPAEIEQRNAARAGGFNSIRFLTRDDPHLAERVAQYAVTTPDATIYEGAPGASFEQIRAMVARHIAARGIKGVVLDYWQLVGGKSPRDSEEWHLREVAQWMADTARREGVFFLTAAQVNQTGNTRGGEGLKLACDQYFTLHREKEDKGAWLEMEESRHTMYQNVGNAAAPGLWLDPHGPHFRDPDRAKAGRAA